MSWHLKIMIRFIILSPFINVEPLRKGNSITNVFHISKYIAYIDIDTEASALIPKTPTN